MEETSNFIKASSSVVRAEEGEPPDATSPAHCDPEEPPSIPSTSLLTLGPITSDAGISVRALRKTRRAVPLAPQTGRSFQHRYYPGITPAQWNDWRWQLQNRVTTQQGISRLIKLSASEKAAFDRAGGKLPFAVTPYYASLIDPDNPNHAIRRTMIPDFREAIAGPGEAVDPLAEDETSPVPGLVHRYPDRVLFLVTNFCSAYCRYCTRTRIMSDTSRHPSSMSHWQAALRYIQAHQEIRDVLISGGDPLTLSDHKLEWLLKALRDIPHVEIIRIGTKAPVVLPQRITPKLVRMLEKYHPLYLSIHFTHPDELTPDVQKACALLAGAGIPLGSQTVLLSGINDDPDVMKRLMQGLLRFRVRPYYLYQCDPIIGSAHFRTPVDTGLQIIRALRGHTSGYAVPTYVIDAPGGGGKI
ncbi:MAG: KamA family radical SAM protein, partial [Actinomycetaceae bacterium]|nr:KamA family radical SAM protein [Actinomycetaceae bacterium]